MATKTADNKGRITLGRGFANQTVVVDDSDPNQVVIRKVAVIPMQEAWLYKNSNAMNSVRLGLAQASQLQFAEKPQYVDSDAS